jgi:AsmA protein
MKVIKLAFWLLGLLVAIVVAASAALVLYFNPNDYRGQIATVVKERTGRELQIDGDIHLSLFPWLGVTVGRMDLGNAPGFGPEPLARVDSAAIKVKALPLLRKEVVLDTIAIRGLTLNLAVDRAGRNNWQLMERAPESQREPAAARHVQAGRGLAAFAIAGLDIRDGRIRWQDARDGASAALEEVRLHSTKLAAGLPFDFEASAQLKSSRPDLGGDLRLASRATFSPDSSRYRFEGLAFGAQLRGPVFPNQHMDVEVKANVAGDLKSQTLEVSELQAHIWNLGLTGGVKGTQVLSAPRVEGNLDVASFDPRATLEALGRPAPATSDAGVLRRASAQLSFQGTPAALTVAPLNVRLDDTALQGELQVRDLTHPAATFKLAIDAIDLDRYLPPADSGAAGVRPPKGAPAGPVLEAAALLPVDVLRTLDLRGELTVGRLKAANLQLQDVRLEVDGRKGQLRVHPADAKLYQGHFQGDLGIDARQEVPRVTVDEALNGIQMEPFLKDFRGSGWLAGTADLNVRLRATGNSDAALRRTAAGTVAFSVRDGAFKGVNIADLIRTAKARLEGKTLAPSAAPNQTDFAELSGTVQLDGGRARNRDLVMRSPLLRISGEGEADLVNQSIDYLLKASIVPTLEGQGAEDLRDLKGVTVPIKVHGSLLKPSFSLDLETLLTERAKAKFQEQKEKLEKKLEDKLQDRLPGLSQQLRQLLGR